MKKNVQIIEEIINSIRSGDIDKAKADYSALLDTVKDQPYPAWTCDYIRKVEELGELFGEEDYSDHAGHFLEILEDKGETEAVYHHRIETVWGIGLDEKREEVIEEALIRFPQNPEFINSKASLLHRQGKTEDALTEIDKALDKEPGKPTYLNTKAQILQNKGDLDQALAEIENALAQNKRHTYHNTKALILLHQKKFPEALAEMDAAIKLAPEKDKETLETNRQGIEKVQEFVDMINKAKTGTPKEYGGVKDRINKL